jgi:hypothetical protein
VRHLVYQRLGEPEVAVAADRGIPARQRDLGGQPAAPLGSRHPASLFGSAPRRGQRGGQPGLPRGGDRFEPFQRRDVADQRRLVIPDHTVP